MTDKGPRHPRWQPGETAVLRFLWQRKVLFAWPCRVTEDSKDLVALFVPDGTRYKRSRRLDGGRPLLIAPYVMEDAIWRRDLLRLMYPGRAYSIWLLWDMNPRRLLCWYVNLEDAFRRSAIGFDTSDHELDVVIRPDLTWYLKDEDELDAMVEAGLFPEERRAEVHEMAKRTISLVENRKPPFCDGWDRWAPDPRWPRPELPPNWAEVD